MFDTAFKIITLVALIGFLGWSVFYPILIPKEMMDTLQAVSLGLLSWDGLLPIAAVLKTIALVMFIVFAWLLFKIFMAIFGFNYNDN